MFTTLLQTLENLDSILIFFSGVAIKPEKFFVLRSAFSSVKKDQNMSLVLDILDRVGVERRHE